jgi:hypothetical protein
MRECNVSAVAAEQRRLVCGRSFVDPAVCLLCAASITLELIWQILFCAKKIILSMVASMLLVTHASGWGVVTV